MVIKDVLDENINTLYKTINTVYSEKEKKPINTLLIN
jgi:hypothetical protein